MFITLIWITFAVLVVVAVFAAHVWAANVIVDRLWPKEDMAKQLKPAGKPRAVDHQSMATRSPARPGPSAPLAGPSTEAPPARSSLPAPVQPAPEPPVSVTDAARSRIFALVQPAHAVTDAARGSDTARSRPATNAERQAAYRARQGDTHRAKEAARKRAARAKQRRARLRAAEPPDRTELSVAS
jgi:hypothetical protein